MITRNAACCRKCNTIIESTHRHDFVSCKCGAIFVDGGLEYLRRGGDPEDFIDMTEFKVTPTDSIEGVHDGER